MEEYPREAGGFSAKMCYKLHKSLDKLLIVQHKHQSLFANMISLVKLVES